MEHQSLSDEELLNRLKDGDRQAFQAIYLRHARRLFDFACRKVAPEVAEEIVQDIFVRLWQKPVSSVDNLSAYLLAAVRYGLLNHFRAEITREKFIAYSVRQSAHEYLPDENLICELQKAVEEALAALPEKTAVIFHLSRFEGLPHKEIAAQLSLSEKSVEYHISQALKHLRLSLKPFLHSILIAIWLHG